MRLLSLFMLMLAIVLSSCSRDTAGSDPQTVSGRLLQENVIGSHEISSVPMTREFAEEPKGTNSSAVPLSEEIIEGHGMVKERTRLESGVLKSTDVSDTASLFNFVDADIREVAKAVLGDLLGMNYSVAPGVQGNITIKINKNLSKNDVLPALNTAFRLNGAVIIQNGNSAKVVTLPEAQHQIGQVTIAGGQHKNYGYGMQIVPLKNVSVEEIDKILKQVAPNGEITPVESTRNVLLITGTEDERSAMLEVIDSFDVDWLSGMSFGLFPLKESNPNVMFNELWEVLGSQSGPLGKLVRLVPLTRLNAILVIASQPRHLKQIKTWIQRLDREQATSDRKIWVYRVQNGRAGDLSSTLQKLIPNQDQYATNAQKNPESRLVATLLPVGMDVFKNATGQQQSSAIAAAPSSNPADAGLRIIADETTNSIIVWATKSEYALIEQALSKLDIVPMQVRIEAVIAEVTLNDDLRYGVQYLLNKNHEGAVLTNASTSSISPSLPGFSAFVAKSSIHAILDLLQSVTMVHVLSSPQLLVLNNQMAFLQVGDQVPISTQSAVSVSTSGAPVVNSIEMKDTGVILKVVPRVNASGMVLMDVSQEVSDVTATTSSNIDSPTIQERKIASSIAVRDGETIALGGLIKNNVTDARNGIPIIQDIPYLGSLFSYSTRSSTRTELLALITPRVIRNDSDVRAATEELKQRMHSLFPINEK